MKSIFTTLITCICLVGLTQIPSTKLSVEQFDISDGLSENVAIHIIEDYNGHMWIGTLDGLNRYDGMNFKVYRDELYIDSVSSNHRVYRTVEDHNRNLFVYKDEGTMLFDPIKEEIIDLSILSDYKLRLVRPINNHSWILTDQEELLIVDENYQVTSSDKLDFGKYIPKEKSRWFTNMFMKNESTAYIVSIFGTIFEFNINDKSLNFHDHCYGSKGYYSSSTQDAEGNIYLASRDGFLLKFDAKTKTFSKLHQSLGYDNYILNSIFYDKDSNKLYLSSRNSGLFTYDISKDSWENFEVKAPGKNSPTSENILSIVRDKNKVLWFGTDQHGILLHDPYLKKFKSLDPTEHDIKWDIRMPRKMEGDRFGNIWIGTVTLGLWKYNTKTDELTNYTIESHPDLLVSNSIIQLKADGDKLYLGYNGSGVSVIDIPSMKLKERIILKTDDTRVVHNNVIWNIYIDRQDRLWFGTRESGLYILEGDSIRNFNSYNSNLSQSDIQTIKELSTGKIVITTRLGGLFEWDEENKDFTKIFPIAEDEIISPKSVLEDSKGNIFLGTDGDGVVVLDKDYKFRTKLNTKNGMLRSDVTCSMLLDRNQNIWISTNFGVSKLKPSAEGYEFEHTHYSKYDGLVSDEFMTGAEYNDGERLWMGNIAGINYFYPETLTDNPNKAEIGITKLQVFNKSFESDTSIYNLKKINLNPGQNAFSLEFSNKGFNIPPNTFYSYRLLGLEDEWSNPNNRRFASYTNLDPGDYVFEVKGTNYDGVWNEEPTRLPINIKAKIFQTTWFRTLALFSVIGLFYALYHFRLRQVKETARLKNDYDIELSQMEMKALRAQINPHFLFNTLNSINNYILQKDGKNASSYLVKFSQLMRNMLSNSANSFVSIAEELKTLELYIQLESMRFAFKFDYFINVDKDLAIDSLLVPPMLLQPFVENAIWHGLLHQEGDNLLEINISAHNNDMIKMTVKDNGIGIEKSVEINKGSSKGKSFGMDITKKRIELINREFERPENKSYVNITNLKSDHGKAAGTEINVFVPRIEIETREV